MRYRIAQTPDGRYVVLPAPLCVVPIRETYPSREVAQGEADWMNRLSMAPAQGTTG